jgi:adenosylcobinamide-GDP ribazoletransferase
MALFPLVGAGIGATVGGIWQLGSSRGNAASGAALATVADAALTGALHLDGLADSADGLFAHRSSPDRLAIMRTPEIGAFGAVTVSAAFVSRFGAMSSIEPSPILLAGLYCCSRSLMVLGSRLLPYARTEGIATTFLEDRDGPTIDPATASAFCGLIASLVLAAAAGGRRGVAGVLTGTVAGTAVLALARRRIGGFTGDVLGAAGVVCETVGLLASAVAR